MCPKCDGELDAQSDGTVLHGDIAHQRETLPIAMQKLAEILAEGRAGHALGVRLVVGRGLIRDEAMRQLSWLAMRGEILEFDHDAGNTGAIFVTLRRRSGKSSW
jgi:DNA-nicking Smr family endonuclease